MNLIVLEDNCKYPLKFISDFRDNGHTDTIIKFLYYQHNETDLKINQNIVDLYKQLNVEILHIDPLCFFRIMEPLFSDQKNIFLYDFSLEGDDNIPDIYKMHIGYALKKISENPKNKNRFFFYTTAANAEQLSNLKTLFSDHVVVGEEGFHKKRKSVVIDFAKYSNFIKIMNGDEE